MRRLWVLALSLLIVSGVDLVAQAQSVHAGQPPGLRMKAEAAFDGHFKYGEWLPIWVELENSGPDLDIEIRVRVTGSYGDTSFATPAPLPTGSRSASSP